MKSWFKILAFLFVAKICVFLVINYQITNGIINFQYNFDIGNIVTLKQSKVYDKKKLAVLVPFRDAFVELLQFVPHIDRFLTNQKIPFHIFVIHQTDDLRFNRGALLNIGYLYTRGAFDYCVHHDIDLLPLNPQLSYEYPAEGVFHIADLFYHPTLSTDIDPYIGGILVVPNGIFEFVSGMRHDFWGWGGEDEELFYALKAKNVSVHKPPHNFTTDRSNTYLHIHNDGKRLRDKTRCKGQEVNTSLPRTPNCDLNGTNYKITGIKEFKMSEMEFTMLNVKLLCDFNQTSWCKC